ncbi:MAG: hypothetical protein HYY65_04455 [Candidatus Tectomicrobia bacterium]|uniref:Uncharacterized protein n=1 Tax=Tectimicrobiota bacterium TaxID=2528274 RepID=A0A932M017_UNCTE|nr:hypothetical protein [Candidatus Tectomicrobia bacterium]
MKVEEYTKRQQQVGRWKINIVSYRLGDEYLCTVDNVEPGAVLARGKGPTREEAEKKAIQKAEEMLGKTRVLTSDSA